MLQKSLATANFLVMTSLPCQIILARAKTSKKERGKKRGKKKRGGGGRGKKRGKKKSNTQGSFYQYLPFNMVWQSLNIRLHLLLDKPVGNKDNKNTKMSILLNLYLVHV